VIDVLSYPPLDTVKESFEQARHPGKLQARHLPGEDTPWGGNVRVPLSLLLRSVYEKGPAVASNRVPPGGFTDERYQELRGRQKRKRGGELMGKFGTWGSYKSSEPSRCGK